MNYKKHMSIAKKATKITLILLIFCPIVLCAKSDVNILNPKLKIIDACIVAKVKFEKTFPNNQLKESDEYKVSDFMITKAIYIKEYKGHSLKEPAWIITFTHPEHTSNQVVVQVVDDEITSVVSIFE
jgi:hypothetical protein